VRPAPVHGWGLSLLPPYSIIFGSSYIDSKIDARSLPLNLTGRRLPVIFVGILFLVTSIPLSSVAGVSALPIIFAGNGSATSINWSGYAVTGSAGSITTAQGSWVVPAVHCTGKATSYGAFWVGIDGYSSSTVEQTGTDSDCRLGKATYYAWFEFYPKASKDIAAFPIHPGDVVTASVQYAAGIFTVSIQDITAGTTFSSSSTVAGAQRSSAEFIVEAPETCLLKCSLTKLANFGTAGFGSDNTGVSGMNCGVAVNGVMASLGSYGSAVQSITMVSRGSSSVVKAQPSALSADGTSFTVQWLSAGP
jgi:Peptidase A4 family